MKKTSKSSLRGSPITVYRKVERGIYLGKRPIQSAKTSKLLGYNLAYRASVRGVVAEFSVRRYGGSSKLALKFARLWIKRVTEALPKARYVRKKAAKTSKTEYSRVGIYHKTTKTGGFFTVSVIDLVTLRPKRRSVAYSSSGRTKVEAEAIAIKIREDFEKRVSLQREEHSKLIAQITDELKRNRPNHLVKLKAIHVADEDIFLCDPVHVPKMGSPWATTPKVAQTSSPVEPPNKIETHEKPPVDTGSEATQPQEPQE